MLMFPASSQQDTDARCRLLSEAADVLSGEQLGQLERDANGYPVKLLDVARGFDVAGLLSAWEGSFSVSNTLTSVCRRCCVVLPSQIRAMCASCFTSCARHRGGVSSPSQLMACAGPVPAAAAPAPHRRLRRALHHAGSGAGRTAAAGRRHSWQV